MVSNPSKARILKQCGSLVLALLFAFTIEAFAEKPVQAPVSPQVRLGTPYGGVPRTDYFNVRSFGAVGDGETDNTAAFQKALKAAGKAGGGIV